MRWARPSTIAVLPTPGSPISTGLFLVRRERTWITRRISSSRPITGSSLPCSAASREVAAELLAAPGTCPRGSGRSRGAAPRTSSSACEHRVVRRRRAAQGLAGRDVTSASASSRCSVEMYSSPSVRGLALGGAQDGRSARARCCGLARRRCVIVGSLSSAALTLRRGSPRRARRACAAPARRCRRACSSRTASRCSGVICGLRRLVRERAGRRSASWDLIVKRSRLHAWSPRSQSVD